MRRVSVLVAVGIAALAFVTSIEAAGAAAQHSATSADFSLAIGHGFRVDMEAAGDEVVLTVARHRQFAIYSVHGQVSPSGEIEARFGGLGRISVAFERESADLHPCREELMGVDGVFAGTISFRGERNYLGLDASRAKGSLRPPAGAIECPPEAGEPLPAAPTFVPDPGGGKHKSRSGEREDGEADEPTTAYLTAHAPGKHATFIAIGEHGSRGRRRALFFGAKVERRGQMEIVRGASASAKASAFAFDDRFTSATVRPPKPFQGKASFAKEPGGATSWTGSLAVPILGGDRLRLAGRYFAVKMVRKVPSD